jgi:hypothetical protein
MFLWFFFSFVLSTYHGHQTLIPFCNLTVKKAFFLSIPASLRQLFIQLLLERRERLMNRDMAQAAVLDPPKIKLHRK